MIEMLGSLATAVGLGVGAGVNAYATFLVFGLLSRFYPGLFEGPMAEFFAFLRTDPQFYAKTPYELLAYSSYISKKADWKMDETIGFLPRRRHGIRFKARASVRPKRWSRSTTRRPAARRWPGCSASTTPAQKQPAGSAAYRSATSSRCPRSIGPADLATGK